MDIVVEFKDIKPVVDTIHPYSNALKNSATPIVIDNGSYNCRVGWATSTRPLLVFKNVLAKPRKERGKKDGEMQIGNDIPNIEAVRGNLKTQFDKNVVTHMEVQEYIFNYTFSHLGIDTNRINHPIVITEAPLNPNFSRSLMSQLLFECFNVPSVAYCVDSLSSYWRFPSKNKTSLLVSIGYYTTHVIPIVDGIVDFKRSRRLDLGGQQITYYLQRLLQLKYPVHFNALNLSRAEELLHEHCSIAVDYRAELTKWADPDYYDTHVKLIQLPFTAPPVPLLTPEQQKGRRRETARKLVEVNARKREEKLAEDEEQLNQLLSIQDLLEEGEDDEYQRSLEEFGLKSADELLKTIATLQAKIERIRQKIANSMAGNPDENVEEPKPKIMKQMQIPRNEEDFNAWLESVRKKREELLERKAARKQRRIDMAKRRTLASVERMRLISQLAADNEKKEDDFGRRDQDWDVYKVINREGDSDSEAETERLMELEEALRAHDPTFMVDNSRTAQATAESHRLHFAVEAIRATEAIFQPQATLGWSQAGLTDMIEWVLKMFPEDVANLLAQDVCLTGGLANLPGLKEKITALVVEMRPFKSKISVRTVPEPSLGAWLGCRDFARNPESSKYFVTRAEYDEYGGDYLKEHSRSNVFNPLPAMVGISSDQQSILSSVDAPAEDIEVDIL
ncbi:Actin-related protein [Nesidiocoris tenuis]|uniref:Actin-related protein n=1 Tax=Nesidiocoris tenuis TaxID=355587 RepID=A0ABN7AR93_9HEMI|nr:Actin-related protein [Nesidiocoris tenuis]